MPRLIGFQDWRTRTVLFERAATSLYDRHIGDVDGEQNVITVERRGHRSRAGKDAAIVREVVRQRNQP